MQTPHFRLLMFDIVGTNDTHQNDPITKVSRAWKRDKLAVFTN
jgi:hypothetical protein